MAYYNSQTQTPTYYYSTQPPPGSVKRPILQIPNPSISFTGESAYTVKGDDYEFTPGTKIHGFPTYEGAAASFAPPQSGAGDGLNIAWNPWNNSTKQKSLQSRANDTAAVVQYWPQSKQFAPGAPLESHDCLVM